MIISKTPLRASFFGGGSDFKDYYENSRFGFGEVLSTALNMYVYITVTKKFDDQIRVCYSQNEIVDSVDQVKHNIIREALKMAGITKGIEIIYTADLPLATAGVGLASSSAIAVGTLNALLAYKGVYASPEQLARMACELEIERLSNPIGIQDQYAAAYGGFRRYRFFSDGSVGVEPLIASRETMRRLSASLMLFYTGVTRNSSVILKEQNDTIPEKMDLLDSMVEDAEICYRALYEGRIDEWGLALDRVWNRKKKLASGISNPLIDEMYKCAKKAGALGGKILGAGGGGFLLVYAPEGRREDVRKALRGYREIDFSLESGGTQIIFSN
ncbi:MAG: GHMP kinase [Oscillibacter sp.]|nr:GHMP kinase [Oscillibacter sp.]